MGLEFVNLRGEPVMLLPQKTSPTKKLQVDAYHKGWMVVGFSAEHLAEGRHLHDAAQSGQADTVVRKPFDEAIFMRVSKPRKVRSKPYEVYSAAEACAELARRSGWRLVQVQAKAKG